MKRVFLCIFTCLLAIFIMSHNVFAYDLTHDVRLIQGNYQSGFIGTSGLNMSLLSCYNSLPNTYCVNTATDEVVDFSSFMVSVPDRYYELGDYITLDLYLFNNSENNSMDAWVRNLRLSSNAWDLIDVKSDYISSSSSIIHITTRRYNAGQDNFLTFQAESTAVYSIKLYPNEGVATGLATVWRPIYGNDYSGDLQNVISAIQSQPNYSQTLNDIKNNIPTAQDNASAMADEEEQRTQDVVDQSEQDSQDSQDDVDQATSTLLAVGGQVVDVIVNTAATNCNLPMKFTHYDMGVVNLCSGMPTNVLDIIRGVSALVFIPVIVNYALYLVNKLVSIYRSFQS